MEWLLEEAEEEVVEAEEVVEEEEVEVTAVATERE